MVLRNVLIAIALTAFVVAAADISEEPVDGELMHIPPMPPTAEEAVHEEDPTAAKMLKQEEAEDPVLNFLDDAMMKTGPFMPAEDRAAVNAMDEDIAHQHEEQMEIAKSLQKHEKEQQHHKQALSRFAALRAKYATFSEESHVPVETFVEHKKKGKTRAKRTVKPQHTKPWTKKHHKPYLAPAHYSAIPKGKAEKKAAAALAKGAASWAHEDLKVHRETYRELHPGAFWHKKKAAKKIKRKAPTPLKDAERFNHHSIETIRHTKAIIHKQPKRLSLKGAKRLCKKNKALAKHKCAKGRYNKNLYCKTHGTTAVQCSKRGMKVAADCKVAHETAYNNCLFLWKKAKKIIADRKARLAAPMKESKKQVLSQAKKSAMCTKLMAASTKTCKSAMSGYKKSCKKKMDEAVDDEAEMDDLVELQEQADKAGKKAKKMKKLKKASKAAAKAAAKSANRLRKAKAALQKAGASGAMSKAIQKCAIAKNNAKRKCLKAIDHAHHKCGRLLRGEISLSKKKGKAKGKKAGKKAAKKAKKAAKAKKKKAIEMEEFETPEDEEEEREIDEEVGYPPEDEREEDERRY